MTPMMTQYLQTKSEYQDHILLYRLGDFYEMFFEDAKIASKVLEITLTGKDCGEEERAPMCGVPFHSVDSYIERLVANGYKVAICEQTEDPAEAKGLVKREVVRLITPGTLTQSEMLEQDTNNYLASVYTDGDESCVCFADISTGYVSASSSMTGISFIINECGAYKPKEVIINKAPENELSEFFSQRINCMVNIDDGDGYDYDYLSKKVSSQFPENDITSFSDNLIKCIGVLLEYIVRTQKTDVSYINKLNVYSSGNFLQIDLNSRRSLELCETMRQGTKKGSLLWVLDHTATAAGARLLRSWISEPLYSQRKIIERQNCVQSLYDNYMASCELHEALKGVLDLQRLGTKTVYGSVNPRDMKAISQSISRIPKIKEIICSLNCPEFNELNKDIDELSDIRQLIDTAFADEVPFSVREGGFIRDGYHPDVDYLRSIMKDGKHWIAEIESAEREKTGIKTLKISYNKVFGYYIEVTKSNIGDVPDRYIRKQTLTNCERYITQELKDLEGSILGASDKIVKLEYELFCKIRDYIKENIDRLMLCAEAISKIDVFRSLAHSAQKYGYVRPEVDLSDMIYIKDGRHPVVERFLSGASFVSNDTTLDTNHNRLMLITGPNMAGKSTYMRQIALIVIMAQIGSFVPASEARVGICDKIFTRVGASDDLASGQSTFMLEMNEVANILKNATQNSLIIYDEIGRGTSTYDGMSIARATAEYTAQKIKAKTLFATHYHELTELEGECEGVVNYNIAAKKRGDDITFLRKIIPGPADESYGIEVAKLAGIPKEVIKRAKEVLAETDEAHPKHKRIKVAQTREDFNISMESVSSDEIREKLKNIDLNILSPIDAFDVLRELKKLL